jgi:hypothetical protein
MPSSTLKDSKIPYANLPLSVQPNVDADCLATRELRERPNLIHHTPHFPNSKVQLLLGGSSVSRNLPGAIRKHQGLRTLYPYLLERSGWPDAITGSVNFDGFAAAYKTCFKQRKFVFKLCVFLLPTGKVLSNHESRYADKCPPALGHTKAITTSSNVPALVVNAGALQPHLHFERASCTIPPTPS